jgi:hypothetical protein
MPTPIAYKDRIAGEFNPVGQCGSMRYQLVQRQSCQKALMIPSIPASSASKLPENHANTNTNGSLIVLIFLKTIDQ